MMPTATHREWRAKRLDLMRHGSPAIGTYGLKWTNDRPVSGSGFFPF